MSELTIRTATPHDAEAIVAGNLAIARETEDRGLDRSVLRAGVQAALRDLNRGVYFVAESDGRVAGHLLITREWSDWRNAWFWWIQSVYVFPEFRGRGVYRALHRHVERLAQAEPDVCGVRLYVEDRNQHARRVYERLGMTHTSYHFYETDWSGDVGGPANVKPAH